MWYSASNDRTMHQHAAPIMEQADGAFMMWLRQQQRMLESWEQELVGNAAKEETLSALQAHKMWLRRLLNVGD